MLEAFLGPDPDKLNQANMVHATNVLAVLIVLEEKGLLTMEEFTKAQMQATHIVEQQFAQKREDAEREFDEQHPGVRDMLKRMFGE